MSVPDGAVVVHLMMQTDANIIFCELLEFDVMCITSTDDQHDGNFL